MTLLSFGFKHGLPAEADIVLDVRFLPNPYFVAALSASTGEEADVAAFVLDNDDAREFLDRTQALLDVPAAALRARGQGVRHGGGRLHRRAAPIGGDGGGAGAAAAGGAIRSRCGIATWRRGRG